MPSGAFGDTDFETAKRRLAANVASLRARRGWSQQQVADEAGLDLKHVQKVEYAALNPSLFTLVRLARAFGVSIGKLLVPTRAPAPKRPVGRPRGTTKKAVRA